MPRLPRSLRNGALGLLAGVTVLPAVLHPAIPAAAHPATPARVPSHLSAANRTLACPLDGPSTFDDSWGAPRSGGRRHQGVDLIAPRGTPVIAVQSGAATFKQNRLGGNAVWIVTPDGNKFYYAHLDRFEGESREVRAGELIGYVGSTGNASGPHLHFEIHFDGVVANPYPATLTACVAPPPPAPALHQVALPEPVAQPELVVSEPGRPEQSRTGSALPDTPQLKSARTWTVFPTGTSDVVVLYRRER